MLRQRVLSALVGTPLALAAVWFGYPWFALLMAAVVLLACHEFYRLALGDEERTLTYLGMALALGLALGPLYPHPPSGPILITTAVILPLIWLLLSPPRKDVLQRWGLILAGIFYIGWLLSHLVSLRGWENGREWVIFALLVTFASDTAAFFGGRALGRHRLAPTISPGKTWEGGAAGLLGAIAAGLILAYLLRLPVAPWQTVLLSSLVGVSGQLGDLAESLLKRGAGVKDSGGLVPGHGGILDRLDSVVLTGPVVYYFVVWIG
jgi:phosphatidate cytidylyltransferase